jgi:negative regulator of sigma E activity
MNMHTPMYMSMVDPKAALPLHETMPAPEGMTFEQYLTAYLTVDRAWQEIHLHEFGAPGRNGDTSCTSCGVTAWSPQWVRDGYMGEHTGAWAGRMVHMYEDLVAQRLLERELGAVEIAVEPVQVIVAMTDPNEPARKRLTVPQMVRNLLVHPDHA